MLKVILAFIVSLSLFAKSDIDAKISNTSSKIVHTSKEYSKLHSQLKKNASTILKEKNAYKKLNKRLKKLSLELSLKEDKYRSNSKEIKTLEKSYTSLKQAQNSLEEELIFAIARNISLSMLLDDDRAISAESLMYKEILEKLRDTNRKKIQTLNKKANNRSKKIKVLSRRTKKLKKEITSIDKKRAEIKQTTRKSKKLLRKLSASNKKYQHSIIKLLNQKKSLNKTLHSLHIIKEDEKEKRLRLAKEKALKKKIAQASKQISQPKVSNKHLAKVKLKGSSYQAIKYKKYRGKKTIAPLDRYTLIKKFGPYTDPVYGIKIFNESVSLKAKNTASKVKAVLNGKVILAKHTAMLDNVVIIEHSNGIHTIYAHLDKIAPNIKDGKRLKKGSVIGRVDYELMFEVTQKNYHLNPMQLIK